MKKIFTLTAVLAFLSAGAQKKVEVRESNENIGGSSHNAMVVTIYTKDAERIEKAFKDKMKDFDAKVSTKKEIFADNASWKAFGPNTFDVYARVDKDGEAHKLIVGVDMGGAYLSSDSHSEQFRLFKNMIQELSVKIAKDEIAEELKLNQKTLGKLEEQQKDLVDENGDLKNDIENYKKKIAEAENKIKTNEENQVKKKEEIEKQKGVVKEVEEKLKKVE